MPGLQNPPQLSAVALQANLTAVQDALHGTAGIAAFPTPGVPAGNGVSLAEVLRYVQGLAEGDAISHPRYLSTVANMAVLAWNTVAAHKVFNVTGTVRLRLWVTCTATLTDAADLATISLGYEGDNAALIAATDAAGKNAQTLTAGQLWYDSSPTSGAAASASAVLDYVVPNGLDIGYEIAGEALTGGSLTFHCLWWPLDATGAVVIGDGGPHGA